MNLQKILPQTRQLGRNIIRRQNFCSRPKRPVISRPRWGSSLIPADDIFSKMVGRHFRLMDRVMEDMARPWAGSLWRSFPRFELDDARDMQVTYNKVDFEVKIDASNFEPEDLDVKMSENKLTISGKQEQQKDKFGYLSREFSRVIEVPEDVDAESLEIELSNDGILSIRGNVKPKEEKPARKIEIKKESKAHD